MIEEGAHPRHPGFLMLNSSTRYDDRRYDKGDRMIADFGACYEGYYGDITRMAIFGEPTVDHKNDHRTACDVIRLCFEAMQPGTPIAELSPGRQPRAVETWLPNGRQPQAHRSWHRHVPSGTSVFERGRNRAPSPRNGFGSGAPSKIEQERLHWKKTCLSLTKVLNF